MTVKMRKALSGRIVVTSPRLRRGSKSAGGGAADLKLERAKSIATIFSAVAIPIVLTVAGYYIQKQLSSEGIRKDYVGIATTILKEKADNQEPELRQWAVKVLDDYSPIPFSSKAKEGLLTGAAVIVGPAWIGPPDGCRIPPKKRTMHRQIEKLLKDFRTLDGDYVNRLVAFVQTVAEEEKDVLETAARLRCMQDWATNTEKMDIEFRSEVGTPSSKSIFEEIRKKKSLPSVSANPSESGADKQSLTR